MKMQRNFMVSVLPILSVALSGGCGGTKDVDEKVSEGLASKRSAIQAEGPVTVPGCTNCEGLGTAYVIDNDATCGGVFLSPQWALTAGHCIDNVAGIPTWTPHRANVYTGNSLSNGQNSTDIYLHPKWWVSATNMPDDPSFDLALIRLPTPASTTNYPNNLFNFLQNYPEWVGSLQECYSYGPNSTDGSGTGTLSAGTFSVTSTTVQPNCLTCGGVVASTPMLQMAPVYGQQIVPGDSGGFCMDSGFSYLISGIIESVSGTGAYLVQTAGNYDLIDWVETTMHSSKSYLGGYPSSSGIWVSGTSGRIGARTLTFAINNGGNNPWMKVRDSSTGNWSSWSALSITGYPGGGERIAAVANNVTRGSVTLNMAVISAADQNMYTGNFYTGSAPTSQWTSFTWTNQGRPPGGFGLTLPAIGRAGDRIDAFAVGADGKIWTNWKSHYANGSWSGWMQLTGQGNNTTYVSASLDVTYSTSQNTYYLLMIGGPNRTAQLTTMTGMSSTVYGNGWDYWSDLGGGFNSGVGIAYWIGGLAIYGVGTDNNLWKFTIQKDGSWSPGWMKVSQGPYLTGLVGVGTGSGIDDSATELDIIAQTAGGGAYFTKMPR